MINITPKKLKWKLFTTIGSTFDKMGDYDDDYYKEENKAKYSRIYIIKK